MVGKDGETHQGMLDMALLSTVPGLTIMAPKDFKELEDMLEFAVSLNKPVVIRYPRGAEEVRFKKHSIIKSGEAEILQEGTDVTIFAIGKMVAKAQRIANLLEKDSIKTEIINARFFKPIDEKVIVNSVEKTKCIATIEDGTISGGLGNKVEEILLKAKIEKVKFCKFAYPDEFIVHGEISELEKKYKLDDDYIYSVLKKLKEEENNNYIKEVVTRGEKCIKNIRKKIRKMKKK